MFGSVFVEIPEAEVHEVVLYCGVYVYGSDGVSFSSVTFRMGDWGGMGKSEVGFVKLMLMV